jgi:DNA (cytosine-5)-methyltransferase 1
VLAGRLAGFHVTGVDIKPQPRYCGDAFIQGDATNPPVDLRTFDFIWASPPCQAYSVASQGMRNAGKEYPDLVSATRASLELSGVPWVIENVPGAPIRPDYVICGCQVGLKLRRERWFESSWDGFSMMPTHRHEELVVSVVGRGTPSWVRQKLGFNPSIRYYREAMGIDWMNRNELSLAIPPQYSEFIARQFLVQQERAA